MKGDVDLLAHYWTLAVGAEPHSDHEYSTASFEKRVALAAKAGFTGFGIWHADLEHTLKRLSLADMRRVLDDHGIRHLELEFLNDWCLDGEPKRLSDERKHLLFEAAGKLGAHHVKVGDFVRQPCPIPRLIERFAGLCKEAENYGTKLAFEMMPFCIIDSLELARELVEGAGAKNGGIYFDLWHIEKLGIPHEAVARFPMQYLVGIELNDGYSRAHSMPDPHIETTQHRQLLGDGEFDVKDFIKHMQAAGWRGPWGIEVLNKQLRQRPIEEVTRRAFDTTAALFRA